MFYPQPRGRPRKDCAWDHAHGMWIASDGKRERPKAAPSTRSFSVRLAPPPNVAPIRPKSATDVLPVSTPADQAVIEDAVVHVDEARSHAIWCAKSVPANTPVYYLDASGTMQKLCDKDPVVRRTPAGIKKSQPKRRRDAEAKVWGPDAERNLAEGEWELA